MEKKEKKENGITRSTSLAWLGLTGAWLSFDNFYFFGPKLANVGLKLVQSVSVYRVL